MFYSTGQLRAVWRSTQGDIVNWNMELGFVFGIQRIFFNDDDDYKKLNYSSVSVIFVVSIYVYLR
jgi:hypothetical protein